MLRIVREGDVASRRAGRKGGIREGAIRRSCGQLDEITVIDNLWGSVFLDVQRDLRSLRCELTAASVGGATAPVKMKKGLVRSMIRKALTMA